MNVNFLEEGLEDFKAFSGKHKFALDLPGVTFVRGDNLVAKRLYANGAAKSTLWDGLCWCLFGRTVGNLRNPDVVPWNESGNPRVTIELKTDAIHTITRAVNPNKLLLDDEEVTQVEIDALLGMNYDLFTNTILLAQGQPLFFDLSPKDKMDLFSNTLQLERWDIRSKAADAAACDAEADLSDLESEKRSNEAALIEVDGFITATKAQAEAWVAEHRKVTRDSAARRKQLEVEFEKKDKQLSGAILKADGAATELDSLNRDYQKLQSELTKLQGTLTKAEIRLEGAKAQLEQLRAALSDLNKARSCPTCGQPVRPANLAKHKVHLEEMLHGFEATVKEGLPPKLVSAEAVLQKRLTSSEQYAQSFQATLIVAEHEKARLQPEVATLRAQIQELQRASKVEEANPHTEQLATLQGRRKELLADKASIAKDIAEASRRAERNKFWVKGFKDIKLQLIIDVLDELDLVTNSMLEEVGLVDWKIQYGVERETKSGTVQRALNVQINSPESKGWVKWESWSGGEKQRLRLIGALALSDVLLAHAGVQTNLEILDEPALYWSTEGVQELCAFLAERARQTKRSIFYIEHQAVESTHFAKVLTVVRDSKGAFIEDEGG